MCRCGTQKKYLPKEDITASTPQPVMDFKFIPEPHLSELSNYVKARRQFITMYGSLADIRAEVLRNITEGAQLIDHYPKGRQFLQDDEYMTILRDLLNLSNILDDMDQTGSTPYQSRTQYHNLYGKIYRQLMAKAGRQQQQ